MHRYFMMVLLAISLLTGCVSYSVHETGGAVGKDSNTNLSSYSARKSVKSQRLALTEQDYAKCLFHCRVQEKLFASTLNSEYFNRMFMATLLRYNETVTKSLESIYDQNLYIKEALDVLKYNEVRFDPQLFRFLSTVLESGSKNTDEFRDFIGLLKTKIKAVTGGVSEDYFILEFGRFQKQHTLWFDEFDIALLRTYDFKKELGL